MSRYQFVLATIAADSAKREFHLQRKVFADWFGFGLSPFTKKPAQQAARGSGLQRAPRLGLCGKSGLGRVIDRNQGRKKDLKSRQAKRFTLSA